MIGEPGRPAQPWRVITVAAMAGGWLALAKRVAGTHVALVVVVVCFLLWDRPIHHVPLAAMQVQMVSGSTLMAVDAQRASKPVKAKVAHPSPPQAVVPPSVPAKALPKADASQVPQSAPKKRVSSSPASSSAVAKKAVAHQPVAKPPKTQAKVVKPSIQQPTSPPPQAQQAWQKALAQELSTGVEAELDALNTELSLRASSPSDRAVAAYRERLLAAVAAHWRVPPNVDHSRWCEVHIVLADDGGVVSAKLLKSSHDPLLDRSILVALQAASPLPVADDARVRRLAHEIILRVSPQELRSG